MIGYSDKLLQALMLVLIILNLYFRFISVNTQKFDLQLKLINDNLGEFF